METFLARLRANLPLLILALSVLAYALYFSYLTILRFDAFEARALDLGNFDQAIWNTAHGCWFHLTNQDGVVNRLSLHVEPILIPISLLYHLYSSPKTLFVLQSTVVALGAIPVFALAQTKLQNGWLALAFAISFLLNPSVQAANWLEFHALTLAPTLLLATFYFLYVQRLGWAAIFAVLAASCKEEMGLLVFMIGLYAFVFLGRRRWGAITMICSLAWALFAVFVVQNLFATGNIHWGRYGYLGDSPLQMVLTLLTQPAVVIEQLASAQALQYGLRMLIPVGLLGLLAPEILLLAMPSLGINLLADFAPMHQVDTLIYAVPIVPFVTVAGIVGASRLLHWVRHPRAQVVVAGAIGLAVVGCSLVNQVAYGYLPAAGNYLPLTVTAHHRNAASIIAQIGPDAKVTAQDRLNPHVSQRETVYIFPRVDDADTIFLDLAGPAWPQHPSDLKRSVLDLLDDGFGIKAALDGYVLLEKGHPNQMLPPEFYTAWQDVTEIDSAETNSTVPLAEFAEKLRLLDARVVTDRYGELVVELEWLLLEPMQQDIGFHIVFADQDWDPLHSTEFYPPTAALWYPTSSWGVSTADDVGQPLGNNSGDTLVQTQVVQTQVVQTLPWTLAEDEFTLLLGLYVQDDLADVSWQSAERLPVTARLVELPVFEGGTLIRLGGYQREADGEWQQILPVKIAPQMEKDAAFGQRFILDGVSVGRTTHVAGSTVDFTLHWRAADLPDPSPEFDATMDYTSFVHLIDMNEGADQGRTVAQLDWQPHDDIGRLPTSAWIAAQPINDSQQFQLPADLAAGTYQLIVGMYDWRDGARLPVSGNDALPGDIVEIAQITVEDAHLP